MIVVFQSPPGVYSVRPSLNVLDQPDADRAEDGARQVADAAEHRGGEREQAEAEARVVLDVRHEQGVEDPGEAGEEAGDQERERDRPVDVDAHHRGGVLVLGDGAHRLALLRLLDEVDEPDQRRIVITKTISWFTSKSASPIVKILPCGRMLSRIETGAALSRRGRRSGG